MRRLLFFCLFPILGACSQKSSSAGSGGASATTTTITTTTAITTSATSTSGTGGTGGAAPSPPPRPIIPNQGGPVIATPEIVTVTWKGDPIASNLLAFDQWMVASPFFSTMMAEWGVSAGTHDGELSVATPAPAMLDDTAIQIMLQDAITQGTVPPANGSRIYTVYPPLGTTVVQSGYLGCTDFQAYHESFSATLPSGESALAVYVVTPRCANTGGMTPTDFTTWGASHEVMEASSDPNALAPAWVNLQQTPAAPQLGESADFCLGTPFQIDGYTVTRNYSNVAAMAGERPCVPAPPGPMFGAFTSPDSVALAPGASTTIPVYLYATGPLPQFQVAVQPFAPALHATLDKASGVAGDVLSLTISADANYVEMPGQNLIEVASISNGYPTYRFVIVH